MSSPVIIALTGPFYSAQSRLYVEQEGQDPASVDDLLEGVLGRAVDLAVHHLPPKPPQRQAPGFGSCLWRGQCPLGHREDPTWLYSAHVQGVLSRDGTGTWVVGGHALPLLDTMPGHQGQLAVFAEGSVEPDASADTLVQEAQDLVQLLSGLKAAVGEEP